MSFHELKKYFQTLPPPQHIDFFDLNFQGGCHLTCGTFNETSKGQIKRVAQSSQKESAQLEHKDAYCIRPLRRTPCSLLFPLMECSFSSLWEQRASFLLPSWIFRNQGPSSDGQSSPSVSLPNTSIIWLPLSTLQKLSRIPSPLLMEGQGHRRNLSILGNFGENSLFCTELHSCFSLHLHKGRTYLIFHFTNVHSNRKIKSTVRADLLEI